MTRSEKEPNFSWAHSAAAGMVVWSGAIIAGVDGSTSALGAGLLLLGSLVVTPLTLSLLDPGKRRGRFVLARRLHLPAAALLAASFLLAPGASAAALSLPWLALTFLVAVIGGLRFIERGGGPLNEIAIDVGLKLLAVGGIWTFASRSGIGLLGFSEPLVLLTGSHFHFAGLTLPVVIGLAARVKPGPFANCAAAGVTLGVPFVAAGITAGARGYPSVEWIAALWMAGAGLVASWVLVRAAAETPRVAGVLLRIAAASLTAGMVLVAVYATGVWLGNPILSIPAMLQTHAPVNAIGFALTALVALRLSSVPDGPPGMEVLAPWLMDEPAENHWEARPFGPEVQNADPLFAADVHQVELPEEPPGLPIPGGPFEIAADAVLHYRAFPDSILFGMRADPNSKVSAGETIRARYRVLPGFHVVFAARVTESFDETTGGEHRVGFCYRTLAGHPECGEETFYVRKELASGRVFAGLSARSRPGVPLVRFIYPVARRLQLSAGRAGAANLQRLAATGNQH